MNNHSSNPKAGYPHTPEFKSSSKTAKQLIKTFPIGPLVSPAVPCTTGVVTRSTAKALVSTKTQPSDKPNRPPQIAPVSSNAKEANLVVGPVFKPFCPKVHLKKSTSTLVRENLLKPLTKTELETVYLYVYWYPGNFGKVKIGSTKSVKDRMEEQHCICEKKHNEWFETTEQHVKQVIQKWTNWITSKKRYENVVGGRLIQQSTKEKEIRQLCEPIPRPDDFVYTPEMRTRRSARLQAKALDPDAMFDKDEETTSRKKRDSRVPRDNDNIALSMGSALPQKSRASLDVGARTLFVFAKKIVKELIDNALDARASIVSIEISSNTLDIIQVRHNGAGVDIGDRQLLYLYQAPGADQYFSVDVRPLSAEIGIVREFPRLYKQDLRSACERSEAKSFLSKPDSYDINIEPAKNGVLFLKLDGLTSEFEQLITRAYGKLGSDWNVIESVTIKIANQRVATSFYLLMARKPTRDDRGSNRNKSYDPTGIRLDLSPADSLPSRRHEFSTMHVADVDDLG
ncbi:hypothetical protein DV736_g894, partial [Chaetothyriales sp. CBS 134916]